MGKAVLLVALFALLIYASLRLIERRRAGRPRRAEPPITRPLAPDDDPEFLRNLERRRREQGRQQPDEPEA